MPTVLLTRSGPDNAASAARIRSAIAAGRLPRGTAICSLSTSRVLPGPTATGDGEPPDAAALAAEVDERIRGVAALALTSRHGAQAALTLLGAARLRAFRAAGGVLGCVGPATARILLRAGIEVDLIASPATAAGLGAGLVARLPRGATVAHLCGDRARPELGAAVHQAGMAYAALPVYRNAASAAPRADVASRALRADLVLVFAPSAAERLYSLLPALRQRPALAIGPTTAAALRTSHGVAPIAVAESGADWVPALAAALAVLAAHTRRHPSAEEPR